MEALSLFLQLSVQLGTPFFLATLGGIMCEKVGNLNLGIEGMMMMGAFFGFRAAADSANVFAGVLTAFAGGMLAALIYAFITVTLKGDQTVTGFAITTFGTGLANFLGKDYQSMILPPEIIAPLATKPLGFLSKIPVLGTAVFTQSILVYIALAAAVLLQIYFKRTRFGLAARMVGENPATADATGVNVDLTKYIHIILGGGLCGLGGGYLSLVYVPYWQNNITAGMGWIAVALVIFSSWSPVRAIYGCYLFGILKALAIKFQGVSFTFLGLQLSVSPQLMDMMPYILTVAALVLAAVTSKSKTMGPAGIGKPYFREDR